MAHALAHCRTPAHLAPIVITAPITGHIRPEQVVYDGSQDGKVEHQPHTRPAVERKRAEHIPSITAKLLAYHAAHRSTATVIAKTEAHLANVHSIRLYVPQKQKPVAP